MFSTKSHKVAAIAVSALILSTSADVAQAQSSRANSFSQLSSDSAQLVAAGATVDYQTLYVNPTVGNDRAQGVEAAPLQTVTRALELAAPNTVIVLAPGRYSQASGEVFPLQLKSGVTIQGTPGARNRSAIIEGGGNFESPTRRQQNAAIIAADRAGLAQVAVSNPNGYGLWIESASPTILESAFVGNRQTGIYVSGGSPRVQGSYFSGNQIAGLIVQGVSSASIQSNTFDSTGDAIRVEDGATPEIVGNRMTNNNAGLVVVGGARPAMRGNRMTGNRRNDVVEMAANADDVSLSAAATSDQTIPKRSAPAETSVSLPAVSSALAPSPQRSLQPVMATRSIAPEPTVREPAISEPVTEVPVVAVTPAVRRPAVRRPVVNRPVVEEVAVRASANEPTSAMPVTAPPMAAVIEVEVVDEPAVGGPGVEADRVYNGPKPGAPGSALSALRAGVASTVALGPRAVTGDNPDSPVLRRRDRRSEPENNNRRDRRPQPAARPVPANDNRLAVPSSNIPVGSGSGTVFSPPRAGAGAPPAPPSRAQALGLYYRVFVEASDPFVQDDVKSVVPDAFRTQFEGRTVMQVGAFPTEDEAEDRQRLLEDNGLNARVEYIR